MGTSGTATIGGPPCGCPFPHRPCPLLLAPSMLLPLVVCRCCRRRLPQLSPAICLPCCCVGVACPTRRHSLSPTACRPPLPSLGRLPLSCNPPLSPPPPLCPPLWASASPTTRAAAARRMVAGAVTGVSCHWRFFVATSLSLLLCPLVQRHPSPSLTLPLSLLLSLHLPHSYPPPPRPHPSSSAFLSLASSHTGRAREGMRGCGSRQQRRRHPGPRSVNNGAIRGTGLAAIRRRAQMAATLAAGHPTRYPTVFSQLHREGGGEYSRGQWGVQSRAVGSTVPPPSPQKNHWGVKML